MVAAKHVEHTMLSQRSIHLCHEPQRRIAQAASWRLDSPLRRLAPCPNGRAARSAGCHIVQVGLLQWAREHAQEHAARLGTAIYGFVLLDVLLVHYSAE